jgi:hypothetical protein
MDLEKRKNQDRTSLVTGRRNTIERKRRIILENEMAIKMIVDTARNTAKKMLNLGDAVPVSIIETRHGTADAVRSSIEVNIMNLTDAVPVVVIERRHGTVRSTIEGKIVNLTDSVPVLVTERRHGTVYTVRGTIDGKIATLDNAVPVVTAIDSTGNVAGRIACLDDAVLVVIDIIAMDTTPD